MKITKIEVIRTTKPIPLPGEYLPAWEEPDGIRKRSYDVALYKVRTDEGIVGYGPYMGRSADLDHLIDFDPFMVEKFWDMHMAGTPGRGYGGLDAALWDIIGKAAGLPVYKLLGARDNKIQTYAATSRLCSPEEHVEQVQHIMSAGFRAVKLRLHRPDYRDDIKAVEAVRAACGDGIRIAVDCNQNNPSKEYPFWSRDIARTVCREMQNLGVYFIEEPLPRLDVEGLGLLADEFDTLIAGGEHSPTIYDLKEHLRRGAYDILQPDLILGNIGVTGMQKLGHAAEFFDKIIIPHVCGLGSLGMCFAGTVSAVAGLGNCPMIEFPYDPPFLTEEIQQFYIKNKFRIDAEGYVTLPEIPGIGADIDEDALAKYL